MPLRRLEVHTVFFQCGVALTQALVNISHCWALVIAQGQSIPHMAEQLGKGARLQRKTVHKEQGLANAVAQLTCRSCHAHSGIKHALVIGSRWNTCQQGTPSTQGRPVVPTEGLGRVGPCCPTEALHGGERRQCLAELWV